MGNLIKFEIGEIPDILIVGKEIKHSRKELMIGNNPIPAFWERCFKGGIFSILEEQVDFIYNNAYVGVMIDWDSEYDKFSYVAGMLMKIGADIPQGFVSYELSATKVAIGWIQGKNAADAGSMAHEYTVQALKENGYACNQMRWCMELFNCPRFTAPDENGNIILDYYIPAVYVKDKSIEVEDAANLALNGETLENAIDFFTFLRENGFQMEYNPQDYEEGKWSGAIGGIVGDSIGYMHVRSGSNFPDPWAIWLNVYEFEDSGSADDEELKEFVWENLNSCTRCHPNWKNCGGGEKTVFGRKFERLCHSPLVFYTPGTKKLEKLKKLLEKFKKK